MSVIQETWNTDDISVGSNESPDLDAFGTSQKESEDADGVETEWGLVGVSADILADGVDENKQTVDNIVLRREDLPFLLPENALDQEFSNRKESANYYQLSRGVTHRLDEESRKVISEEFTRSYVTVSVLANQPDIIESVFDVRDFNHDSSPCIFHHYHPNYSSWQSNLKNTISYHSNLKSYINGEFVNDRCVLVRFHQLSWNKILFEPLFANVCIYYFNDNHFVRISESFNFDMSTPKVRTKYDFLYDSNSSSSRLEGENNPCIFSIPSDIPYDKLFMVVVVTKVLTSSPENAVSPYLKSATTKLDDTKYIDTTRRLCDYRQPIAFGVLRILDEQGRCGQNGGPNISSPLFAFKQAMNDSQLCSIVRDLFPVNHGQPVPTTATISKAKLDTLDMELVFAFADVGVNKV